MEDIKDIYTRVYKKCPQDGETLYKFIMAMMKNKNISERGNYAGVHKDILLAGNFGIGKTTMVRECAKELNLPFHEFIASTNGGIDLGFDENFYDVINELWLENDDEFLNGVILINNLEEIFIHNAQKNLGNYIKKQTLEISDTIVHLDNIIYVGEFDISNYLNKSNFTAKFRIDKLFSRKNRDALIKKELWRQYNSRIYKVFNSRDMRNIFSRQIIMPDLDKEDIRRVLLNSSISEYQEFLSHLDIDEFGGFTNKEVIDYIVSSVNESPLKLNAISPILENLYIDAKKHVKKP